MFDYTKSKSEDEIRDAARDILQIGPAYVDIKNYRSDVGQNTSNKMIFGDILNHNQLKHINLKEKPDGWLIPLRPNGMADTDKPFLVLETTAWNNKGFVDNDIKQITSYVDSIGKVFKSGIGVLWNGFNIIVYMIKDGVRTQLTDEKILMNNKYYLDLLEEKRFDSARIQELIKQINDILHFKFDLKNYNKRMILSVGCIVARDMGQSLDTCQSFPILQSMVATKLEELCQHDLKKFLIDSFKNVNINNNNDVKSLSLFVEKIGEVQKCISSRHWDGEDVMAVAFNEFNKYKVKAERGQVFTPVHIAHCGCRLIDLKATDNFGDFACGVGTFLIEGAKIMTSDVSGFDTQVGQDIINNNIFGVEFDKDVCAFVYSNLLIHKIGSMNVRHGDTRSDEIGKYILDNKINKAGMNPPFENGYGCLEIVKNTLDNMVTEGKAVFILPDKKLEKNRALAKKILARHTLKTIVKLPEKLFKDVGVTTSLFIFEVGGRRTDENGQVIYTGVHGDAPIYTCYLEDDGLETVKNKGRKDVHGNWKNIEDRLYNSIRMHTVGGEFKGAWLSPDEGLSYQVDEEKINIQSSCFSHVVIDSLLYNMGIDKKEFVEKIIESKLYNI
jgi:type I restriction-modification system DNA methylase subunit